MTQHIPFSCGGITGGAHRRTYDCWKNMVGRCSNPRRKDYARYGGRGVRVCERWLSFEHFLADMGVAPPGLALDREKNELGYEPGNCRWVSTKVNTRNRRCTKKVAFRGEMVSVPDLAERFNVEVTALYHRLKIGWDIERAVTQPGARGYFARPSGDAKTRARRRGVAA